MTERIEYLYRGRWLKAPELAAASGHPMSAVRSWADRYGLKRRRILPRDFRVIERSATR